MINVLFIGMTSHHSGLETYTTDIFSKLQNKGFQFSFINTDIAPLAYSKYIVNNGGNIYNISMPRNKNIKRLKRYFIAKHFFKSHHDFDIVHINSMTINQLYWAKAAKRCGISHIIMQSHNSGDQYPSIFNAILRKLLAFYDKLYINHASNIFKLAATNDSGRWMFGKNSNFKVVNIGMDTKPYKYNFNERALLKNKLGLSHRDKVIIITARLEKQKNYSKIINVFKIMHDFDHNIKLIIIGKGSERNDIKSHLHAYGLDSSTYMLGEISKNSVAKFLNVGDLTLIPSLCEAIPYSILEAQAAGIPVVASDVIPKESDVTGQIKFLSLRYSNKQWAKDALKLLSNSSNHTENRIRMNNQISKSIFSLDHFITHIKNIYINIINDKDTKR